MKEEFVKRQVSLLIADRNPRVGNFLRREMVIEGYHVRLVNNGQEVLQSISYNDLPDMIILDPDLPDTNGLNLIRDIHQIAPELPIVIHSYVLDLIYPVGLKHPVAFVEKQGSSIDNLKQIVKDVINVV